MGIERVYAFLDAAQSYSLATVEGSQPRVRIFGTALLYEGKLYIQTGKIKNVSHQIAANPKFEICAFKDGKWMRLSGTLAEDDRREVKAAMLEKMPTLGSMYNPDDGNMQMLYVQNWTATFSSFTEVPETICESFCVADCFKDCRMKGENPYENRSQILFKKR